MQRNYNNTSTFSFILRFILKKSITFFSITDIQITKLAYFKVFDKWSSTICLHKIWEVSEILEGIENIIAIAFYFINWLPVNCSKIAFEHSCKFSVWITISYDLREFKYAGLSSIDFATYMPGKIYNLNHTGSNQLFIQKVMKVQGCGKIWQIKLEDSQLKSLTFPPLTHNVDLGLVCSSLIVWIILSLMDDGFLLNYLLMWLTLVE